MKRHTMRQTSSVTRVARGCGECDFVVMPIDEPNDDPMLALQAHAEQTDHIVVVEERTTRNYVKKGSAR